MLREYLPVFLQIVVAMLFAGSALLVSILVGKSGKRTLAKDTAYECGMVPQGEVQPRFSVKFYLVAMLFILFDLEIVFMYPWAEVLSIKCGKRVDPEMPWPFFIAIDFESMDKYAIFREDSIHVKFMEEVIKPNTADSLTLDFEMDPGKDVRFS